MSRGSTFVILRKDKYPHKVTEEQVMEVYKDWCDCLGNPLGFKDVPDIAYYHPYAYVDKASLELLSVLTEASFTSSFKSLIEHYNLSYYTESGKNDRVVISSETARSMLQAIKYLIYADYSKRTEALLDNKWIDVFSEHSITYFEWKYGTDCSDDDESEWYLKRLRQVLETYLFINEESDDEITLLYYAWG